MNQHEIDLPKLNLDDEGKIHVEYELPFSIPAVEKPAYAREVTEQEAALLDEVEAVVFGDHQDLIYLDIIKPSTMKLFEHVYRIEGVEPYQYKDFSVWASEELPPHTLYVRHRLPIKKSENAFIYQTAGFVLHTDADPDEYHLYSGWKAGEPMPSGHYQVTSYSDEFIITDNIVEGKTLGGDGVSVAEMNENDFFFYERVWVIGARQADILRHLVEIAGKRMSRSDWGEKDGTNPQAMKMIYEGLREGLAL